MAFLLSFRKSLYSGFRLLASPGKNASSMAQKFSDCKSHLRVYRERERSHEVFFLLLPQFYLWKLLSVFTSDCFRYEFCHNLGHLKGNPTALCWTVTKILKRCRIKWRKLRRRLFVLFCFTISSLILPRVTVTAEFLFFLCENLVYTDRHPFATAKSLTLSIIISIS